MTLVDVDHIPAPIFGLESISDEAFEGEWHQHERHQLLYSARGTLHLEAQDGRWQLPPQRAAWIPGGTAHRASATVPLRLTTVYFDPRAAPGVPDALSIVAASPLLREMVMRAAAFGPDATGEAARRFLDGLAAMIPEWTAEQLSLRLPAGKSDELRAAMRWTRHHLADDPTIGQAARQAGLSSRSLARRFRREVDMTWREYLRQARLLLAMELLEVPDARVTETAYAVGFDSLGAFARAFRQLTGETPSVYRRRVTSTQAR